MKYEYYPKRRTEQERRELNEQILRLLQSEACEQAGVTDEDIFNRYTGDGGLHGLRRSDYENYNAFSAAKKELENGQFFTPPPLCEMIVSALRLTDTDLVADLTCGMGNFFNFLPNERNAYGCEVDPNACAVARKLYPQAHIVQGDIRDYEPQTHFDFVLGNPPFPLRWIMPDATVMTSHQYYCLKAAKLLKPLGILAVIVPASFLADSFSDKGAIRMMESRFSFLGQVMLPEHAFSDSGVDGFPTKLQFWQKKSTAADRAPKRYSTDCADIYIPSGHPVMAASALYEKFVMVAKADLAGNRNKVFLELAQLKTTKSTFLYQVKKYLYQIRSHPVTREKYDACFAYKRTSGCLPKGGEIAQRDLPIVGFRFFRRFLLLRLFLLFFLFLLGNGLGSCFPTIGLRDKLLFIPLILLGIGVTEIVLRPLIAEIIGNIAAVCLLTGARLNAVCLQLVLHIIPCLPADILETVDHALARVHGEPGKAEVINTLGLDKLGNALFHVAPRQLLRICGHTLCGSLEQLCRAHGIQPFQRGLFRPPLFRLLGVPLCFALGFRRFVRTACLILALGVGGGCRFAGRRCRSRSCSRRTCCRRFHRSRLRHIHSIIFRKGVGNGSLAVLKLIIHI